MIVTYKEMSDESDIEIDDMKHVAVQKEAALKDSPNVKKEAILKDSPASCKDKQGNSDIKSGGSRKFVVIYSANVDLASDEQHESMIEKKGNYIVIVHAVEKLMTWYPFAALFGKENAGEQPMLITKKLILVIDCCIRKNRWYIFIGRGESILGH
jgi:hypothetical protein